MGWGPREDWLQTRTSRSPRGQIFVAFLFFGLEDAVLEYIPVGISPSENTIGLYFLGYRADCGAVSAMIAVLVEHQ